MDKNTPRYFTDKDNDLLIYFKLPKVLMVAEKYKKLSNDAKLLYAYYLNLNTMSMERGWKDGEGRYYVKLKNKNAMAFVGCASEKLSKLKTELVKFGLIQSQRMGQGKTNKTYVLRLEYTEQDIYRTNEIFEQAADEADEADQAADVRISNNPTESNDVRKSNTQKFDNRTTRSSEIEQPEVRKSNTINKNYSLKNYPVENYSYNSSSSSNTQGIDTETPNVDNFVDKNEEEEDVQAIQYNLQLLGSEIVKNELMLNDKQVTDTLNLIIDRGLIYFDESDIERAVRHFRDECAKRRILAPPIFFANGLEMKLSERHTYAIGSEARDEIERLKLLKSKVKKVEFYNWLEDRS